MHRFIPILSMAAVLGACTVEPVDLTAALSNQRLTLPADEPDSGPIIFEFYDNGEALLVLDEVVDRGQTPLLWTASGSEVCITGFVGTRRECSTFQVRGNRVTLQNGSSDPMQGFLEPL